MTRRKSVLVVDDDLDVLRLFMSMLQEHVDVKVALGAEAALSCFSKSTFDSVIVDFNMQGPNGAWLLRQIRTLYPDVQRILLSGSSYVDLARHLDPGLVDEFIQKPLEADDLIGSVTSVASEN